MEFNTATLKHSIHQVAQLTSDNLQDAADSLNGEVVDGILKFSVSDREIYGIAGDWLVVFGTDIHIYTDAYFQRNYLSVDKELSV